MFVMSKQVSLPKISLILQNVKIVKKRYTGTPISEESLQLYGVITESEK